MGNLNKWEPENPALRNSDDTIPTRHDPYGEIEGYLSEAFREAVTNGGLTITISQDPGRLHELGLMDARKVHIPSATLDPLQVLGMWSLLSYLTKRKIGYPPAWFPKEDPDKKLPTLKG